MASNTINMSTHSARILAHSPGNTTTFLRGDNAFSSTLTNYLYITTNGQTLTLGAQNSGYIHIMSSDKPFYFNKSISLNGHLTPYTNNSFDLGASDHIWRNIYASRLIGTADQASSLYLATAAHSTSSTDQNERILDAVKQYFNNNKSTVPRNKGITLMLSTGNSEPAIGYFLAGYDSSPYGGFFVCHYGTPRYVGISNGTYTCKELVQVGGTYSLSITGNSNTATTATYTNYINLVAGNEIRFNVASCPSSAKDIYINHKWSNGSANSKVTGYRFEDGNTALTKIYGSAVYNAVWNDFAEYRVADTEEPGRVIATKTDAKMHLTSERLQPCSHIISDTFGCSVGQSDEAKTPIGVAGRVLVYPCRKREEYKIGDCVCAAPNGTADIMSREEIQMYPDRIIGIVDEIPEYDVWTQTLTDSKKEGGGQTTQSVEVKGRIWVYCR